MYKYKFLKYIKKNLVSGIDQNMISDIEKQYEDLFEYQKKPVKL